MNENGMAHLGDVISLSILAGWLLAALPTITLLLTAVWTGIRIYETDTVQRWLGKKHGTSVE